MEKIAVIGMAGKFPEARNINEFYANLKDGRDSCRDISLRRIRNTFLAINKEFQLFGYIEDIDKFDYNFFNILPGEAENMDPHQRLSLEVAYRTIENAGYNPDHINGSNTSVYIGQTNQEYYKLASNFDPTLLTGNLNACTSGRIARFFNFLGNALMVDTACSSSLVAIHMACNDLIFGESEMALVGGVNLLLFPSEKKDSSEFGIDSIDGKARAFSASANGTSNGEAVAFVLLKRFDKAIEDNDNIHAIIIASAVNQDGQRSSNLTAPSSVAQSEVLIKCWNRAKINPVTISYIEAHGTGTPLGDPIEVEGIRAAFSKYTQQKQFCAISALKSNIGHTDSAAGISGLIKVILSLKNKEIFPSLHVEEPNPFIDFINSPVYINTTLKKWETESQQPRRAGLSSFGLSGTNCHILLEEYSPSDKNNFHERGNYPIVISAKKIEALKDNIRSLLNYLNGQNEIELSDLSYTLNAGRKHYEYRFGVIVNSIDELKSNLCSEISFDTIKKDSFENIWFIFSSDSKITSNDIEKFSYAFPVFSQIYIELGIIVTDDINPNLSRFVFQYCLLKFYESVGLDTSKVIGIGSGKILTDYLQAKIELKEAVALCNSLKTEQDAFLSDKLQKFINEKLNKTAGLIVEMGSEGELSRVIKQLTKSDLTKRIEVFNLTQNNSPYDIFILLKKLYLDGSNIKWDKVYNHKSFRKIEVPGYEFSQTRCWFSEEKVEFNPKIKKWFYNLEWIPNEITPSNYIISGKSFLIVMDKLGFGDMLINRLEKFGNNFIKVTLSNEYRQLSTTDYKINFNKEEDFFLLIQSLKSAGTILDGIIQLENFSDAETISISKFDETLASSLYSQFHFLKALNDVYLNSGFQIIQISCNAHKVLNEEISPIKHMSFGLLKALMSENPMVKINSIDLELNENKEKLIERIIKEISSEDFQLFSAYRHGVRYVQKFDRDHSNENIQSGFSFKDGEAYLITGGNRGIGLEIAKLIGSKVTSKIIILGRSNIPDRSQWGEEYIGDAVIKKAIKEFHAIESAGSQIIYFNVDVGNNYEMEKVIATIKKDHQELAGIFHVAGSTGNRSSFGDLTFQDFKLTLNPKVRGSIILGELTDIPGLKFFVMFSSLNTLIPQINTSDYTVANSFQDAYSIYLSSKNVNTTAINWGAWGETGAGKQIDIHSEENLSSAMRAWSTKDGLDALQLAMTMGRTNIHVADIDITNFAYNPFFIVDESLIHSLQHEDIFINADSFGAGTVEKQLMEIWYEVLKKGNISLEDNFFELGGHSLIGSRIINKVSKKFGLNLSFKHLIQYPTIKLFAEYLDTLNDKVSIFDEIKTIPEASDYALSHAQKRLWILSQYEELAQNFVITKAFLLKHALDVDAFKRAFHALIERHEILRTGFKIFDDDIRQFIESKAPNETEVKFRDLQEIENISIDQLIEKESVKWFDLEKPGLIRINLFQLENNSFIIIICMHHIITDDVSTKILVKEVLSLYQAFIENKSFPLVPLKIQYKDYAAWHNEFLNSEASSKLKNYWKDKLKHSSLIQLPSDFERSGEPSQDNELFAYEINSQQLQILREFSREKRVSIFVVLVTLIKALLFRYSSKEDLIVGTPSAGRWHGDLEDQLGFYVNLLPLKTSFKGENTLIELLSKVNETVFEAFSNEAYPFDIIVKDLSTQRSLTNNALIDIVVSYLVTEQEGVNNSLLESIELLYETNQTVYEMEFEFSEEKDKISAQITYKSKLFSELSIHLISSHICSLIDDLNYIQNHSLIDINLSTKSITNFNFEEKNDDLFFNF